MFDLTTKYGTDKDCFFRITRLPGNTVNESIAIVNSTDGPICTVNIVFDDVEYPKEIAIKDYSENEGLLSEMIKLGLVDPPHRYIELQYVNIPVCNLHYNILKEHAEL